MTPETHTLLTPDRIRLSVDLYTRDHREAVIVICPGFFQSKDTPTFQRLVHALAIGSAQTPENNT